jgi:large subunit ribosomal protein L25
MVPLKAAARSSEVSAKQLLRKGVVPGVVYGNKTENTSIQCDMNALRKAFIQAGESTLVELEMDDKKVPVLFHAVQFDPMYDTLRHVDFYAVDMNKEVEAAIPLHFEGEAPAVKDHAAVLIKAIDHVNVRCLPANLPHHLPVQLDSLTEFGSSITAGQLSMPAGVTLLDAPETVLMVAQEPREEEVAAAPAPVAGEAGAAAAPAEGEAAAPANEKKEKEA